MDEEEDLYEECLKKYKIVFVTSIILIFVVCSNKINILNLLNNLYNFFL